MFSPHKAALDRMMSKFDADEDDKLKKHSPKLMALKVVTSKPAHEESDGGEDPLGTLPAGILEGIMDSAAEDAGAEAPGETQADDEKAASIMAAEKGVDEPHRPTADHGADPDEPDYKRADGEGDDKKDAADDETLKALSPKMKKRSRYYKG